MNAVMESICSFYVLVECGLTLAILAGLSAALLSAVVFPINLIVRRWLTASQMSVLWGLVLIRLLIPIAPASTFSLQNLFSQSEQNTPISSPDAVNATSAIESMHTPESQLYIPPALEPSMSDDLVELACFFLPLIWLLGSTFLIASTLFVNWRFSRQIDISSCDDSRLIDLWQDCCRLAKVRKRIPIVRCRSVLQPAVMGVWRVKLLLPIDATDLTDDQLRMVMLHELAHIRRRDVAVNWLLVAVRAVQWWNPVYWLAASRFNSLREQACDAFVLQRFAGQTSRGYGELLLSLARRTPASRRWRVMIPVPILGFFLSAFRQRSIAARLRSLPRAAIRHGRWHALVVSIGTILLVAAGLTDAKQNQSLDEESDPSKVFPGMFISADTLGHDPRLEEQPPVTRIYDLEQVLHRIAGEDRTLEYARNELQATFGPSTPQNPAPSLLIANPKQQGSQPAPHYKWEGNMLTLTASKTAHDDLQQKLQAWSQSGLSQISIEARFLSINQEVVSKANIPWRYLAPGSDNSDNVPLPHQSSSQSTFQAAAQMEESVPVVYSLLNPRQTKSLVHAVLGNRRAKILQAPKITLFNGQQAFVSDVSQRPFVVGVRELAAGVYEPQTAVIDEGTKITLRPVLSADHSRVHLSGRLEFTRVGETRTASIESLATTNEEPVSVQVPNVKRLRIDIATELEDGHSLLLGSPHEVAVIQNSQHLYILLTPRLLEQAAH